MSEINYTAREEGSIGKVFYQNLLASAEYVKTYFPATPGETAAEYNNRPKISVPVTSSIIDRITNILLQGAVLTASTTEAQDRLDTVATDIQLPEFIRDMITNTIVTGNNLAVIRVVENEIQLENWDGPWVWMKDGLSGYEYTMRDGLMVPVLSGDVKEDSRTVVIIDELQFGGVAHGLPFNPSVLTKNVDKYDDAKWGKSFVMRFNDLVVEYNHIVSQISKSIKVLQNVWVTNRDVENPENPIRLSPDRINFLGQDGVLQQAIRNLNLNEEREYLNILEHQISRTSQVPAELAGLRDVGKLPSGIALSILMQPLTELTERFRNLFVSAIEDLAYKVLSTDYIINGESIPKGLEIELQTDDAIFPEDRSNRIKETIDLKNAGLISVEQAQLLLEPILGIDLTVTTETTAAPVMVQDVLPGTDPNNPQMTQVDSTKETLNG